MIILGLDCATKTGWVVYDSSSRKVIESGVQDFTKRRGESNGLMFLRFRKWLSELITMQNGTGKVDLISYEQAHHRGGAATEICVNLTGRVQEIASGVGIECATVRTTTLKKFASGSGRADKEGMMQAVAAVLGRLPIDDNEADAVHVARWTAAEYA